MFVRSMHRDGVLDGVTLGVHECDGYRMEPRTLELPPPPAPAGRRGGVRGQEPFMLLLLRKCSPQLNNKASETTEGVVNQQELEPERGGYSI